MEFKYNDGGRSKYFKAENVGDCVTRAIAIATGLDYKKVYDDLKELAKHEKTGRRKHSKSSVRDGVYINTANKYLASLGLKKVATMQIGKGCSMHLTEDELPKNKTLIVRISKHFTCVKNGVIYDTYNCSEKQYYDEYGNLQTNNRRCVYGYWEV